MSSTILVHIWYHVPKCMVLAVKCRVYAPNCTELVVLMCQIKLYWQSSAGFTRSEFLQKNTASRSEYSRGSYHRVPPVKKRCNKKSTQGTTKTGSVPKTAVSGDCQAELLTRDDVPALV